jgi:hypothetical protein
MARVQTWAEFLTSLKKEAGIQAIDQAEDTLLLELANEALTQAISIGKFLREFRIDETATITAIDRLVTTSLFIAEIDQMYYHRMEDATVDLRYD